MPIPGVSLTAGLGSAPAQATGSGGGLNGLNTADFLKLFLAQLQNQNPLAPASSDQFLTQTAQFSTVQGISQLNENITRLLSLQQLTQGADLIGKKVSYQKPGADGPQSGVVTGVNLVNGQAQLAVGKDTVTLAQVQGIQAA